MSGHIPFAQSAKDVLALALRESEALGHDYIGTEHILLGLIDDADSGAARVLTGLGVTLEGPVRRCADCSANSRGVRPVRLVR